MLHSRTGGPWRFLYLSPLRGGFGRERQTGPPARRGLFDIVKRPDREARNNSAFMIREIHIPNV